MKDIIIHRSPPRIMSPVPCQPHTEQFSGAVHNIATTQQQQQQQQQHNSEYSDASNGDTAAPEDRRGHVSAAANPHNLDKKVKLQQKSVECEDSEPAEKKLRVSRPCVEIRAIIGSAAAEDGEGGDTATFHPTIAEKVKFRERKYSQVELSQLSAICQRYIEPSSQYSVRAPFTDLLVV